MKKVIFVLLFATVAASGCTTDDLATEQDLQDQTSELKHHISQALEKDNNLVREYVIKDIEFDGTCRNESSGRFLKQSHIYERDGGIQEFQGGSYLVKRGVDLDFIDVPECGFDMELESLSLDSVSYNKTVYQNGSPISSSSDTCDGSDITEEDLIYGESEAEYMEWLEYISREIYTKCLDIPVDSWQPVGGENR